MAKLKVPSLQHVARNWNSIPGKTSKLLVSLANNPPVFSYRPLFGACTDLLVLRTPYPQVEESLRRQKNIVTREKCLEVLPLINKYFGEVAPSFVQSLDSRYYPIGKNLMVPFDPHMIFGTGDKLVFPWFSFWRRDPLAGKRLQLFVSIVRDILVQQYPDLDGAKFLILDFSAPASKEPRILKVVETESIPQLSQPELYDMLALYAEEFFLAQKILAHQPPKQRSATSDEIIDLNQGELFDS